MTEIDEIVYIVDDDLSVRKAVARLFRSVGKHVETFQSANEFLKFERSDSPGCLILDIQMPGISGIELQEILGSAHFELPIVFMTGKGDIPTTVKAIKRGAVDFLPKPVDNAQLLATVGKAIESYANNRQLSAELSEFRCRMEALTNRERQVLELVISGLLNKQIAKRLEITEATVKVHRGRVMEKSGVNSVAELARWCEKTGIG